MLTSLFSLFYVTGEFHRFLHRGRAKIRLAYHFVERNNMIKRVIEVPGKVFNPTPLIMGICGWARELRHLVKIWSPIFSFAVCCCFIDRVLTLNGTHFPRPEVPDEVSRNLSHVFLISYRFRGSFEYKCEKLFQCESEKRWGRQKLRTKLRAPVEGWDCRLVTFLSWKALFIKCRTNSDLSVIRY